MLWPFPEGKSLEVNVTTEGGISKLRNPDFQNVPIVTR